MYRNEKGKKKIKKIIIFSENIKWKEMNRGGEEKKNPILRKIVIFSEYYCRAQAAVHIIKKKRIKNPTEPTTNLRIKTYFTYIFIFFFLSPSKFFFAFANSIIHSFSYLLDWIYVFFFFPKEDHRFANLKIVRAPTHVYMYANIQLPRKTEFKFFARESYNTYTARNKYANSYQLLKLLSWRIKN